MADRPIASSERAISFPPFRLLPAQQLLLEGDAPVRLGSRALEILTALVERAGEVVGKDELMARVWPNIFIDDTTLRVHLAGLRKALGDGQPGRRYIANVPGRGYRFVAPVHYPEPEAPPALPAEVRVPTHNLPISKARAVGRADTISGLCARLPRERLVTIVGAGGIGKTTVALAVAEALLPAYADGVRFVDLAPLDSAQFVPTALGTTLGLSIQPEDAILRLIDFLRDKQMLVVLDNCEHVVEMAALLAEQLQAGASGVHILATSREPLRAEGERSYRLLPLDVPADSSGLTAAEALSFSAVQLFVERAAGVVDGYELSDADAPIVSDICRKLGGIALAIELAAARVDAFGIRQLGALLDDRFRVLKQGKRTAQPRHRSLTATLDWSYEFLPEIERTVLRRLSVFVGVFTLESAIAVAGDANTDVVEALANLVAKSLVSADVGGAIVLYRLLETTRAYAMQKLIANGEARAIARLHADYHRKVFERAEAEFWTRPLQEWLEEYGRSIDDVRAALNWAFSPDGDYPVGLALTVGSIPLWTSLMLISEQIKYVESALTGLETVPTRRPRDEMKLLVVLAQNIQATKGISSEINPLWPRVLEIAEELGDEMGQAKALSGLMTNHFFLGAYREVLTLAEKFLRLKVEGDAAMLRLYGNRLAGSSLFFLGDFDGARDHLQRVVDQVRDDAPILRSFFSPVQPDNRVDSRTLISQILLIQGFPDQAVRSARTAIEEAGMMSHGLFPLTRVLIGAACPIALHVGDLGAAEGWIAMVIEDASRNSLSPWLALGQCLKGALLLLRGDATGLNFLRTHLDWLRRANFALHYVEFLGIFALGLSVTGRTPEAMSAINEAIEQAHRNEEYWYMAELLRIKGEILTLDATAGVASECEGYFLRALEWAHRQKALSWELRAAISLAKLWREDGKIAEAKELLSSVYGRFTEGFGTADLKKARALMATLA